MAGRTDSKLDNPNRKKIVEVARWLFYENGYGPTSLGDLAQASGIPKGNFYYHFRSKDDVLRAVVEARRLDVEAQLEDWRRSLGSPRERLHRIVDMLVHDEDHLTRYGCPMGSLLTELGKAQRELQGEAFAVLERIVDFAQAQFSECVSSSPKARELAIHLMGRCQGAVVMAHGFGSPEVLRRETASMRAWIDDTLKASNSSKGRRRTGTRTMTGSAQKGGKP